MPANLALITKTWHALRPALAEEKCSTCECLQGALAELKMALEDLSAGGEQTDILGVIAAALRRGDSHACLGCEPCNPGNILAAFYREQQAHASAPQSCSDAG
jgi:hypothetical protein